MKQEMMRFHQVDLRDVELVQSIFNQAPSYFLNIECVQVKADCAHHELSLLPEGCSREQKHSYIVYLDEEPIGFIDLWVHFRHWGITTVNLLLLTENQQNRGMGTQVCIKLEELVRDQFRCSKIRIGVVDSNPVQGFWKKMGYSPTGEAKPFTGEKLQSTMRVMEKNLV